MKQYLAMAERGILPPDAKVEILEGVIVEKMTRNPPHTVACVLISQILPHLLPQGWFLATQAPLQIDPSRSIPEPDAAVVRGAARDYLHRRWEPADAGLVAEVSDTSLAFDRGAKKRVYARAGILVYWIVNLCARVIEVSTDPTGDAEEPDYRARRDYGAGESVPLVLDGETVGALAVSDLLPKGARPSGRGPGPAEPLRRLWAPAPDDLRKQDVRGIRFGKRR